jgi:hypothetical protein
MQDTQSNIGIHEGCVIVERQEIGREKFAVAKIAYAIRSVGGGAVVIAGKGRIGVNIITRRLRKIYRLRTQNSDCAGENRCDYKMPIHAYTIYIWYENAKSGKSLVF